MNGTISDDAHVNSASAAAERLLPDLDWVLDEAILTAQRLAPVAAAQQRWLLRWERRRAEVLAQDGAIGTAVSLACRQGFVLTRQQALDCGLSASEIRRLGRREWATPRRGVLSVFLHRTATTDAPSPPPLWWPASVAASS